MALIEKGKDELIRESMDSAKEIDLSVKLEIPRAINQFDPEKHMFKCSCCGKGFNGLQKKFFQKSNSPLFQANDGFLPWCKECTDKYYIFLKAFYSNNETHAIEHFCQQADWVYDIEPIKSSRETNSCSRISSYAAKKNLNVGERKTYFDTLRYNFQQKPPVIVSKEQIKDEDVKIKGSSIDRWGLGFSEMDYRDLDNHYFMLKKYNPNADNNQEIFIKSLCSINMLMTRALQSGDSKEYASLVEKYAKTFNQAGLSTIEEKDNSNSEVVGVTLATISQFTPEEFYKDKKLYEDWDELGDYYDRHVRRPMENLMFDRDVRDKEFFVPDEEDYDEADD